jgi:hypothetical protein
MAFSYTVSAREQAFGAFKFSFWVSLILDGGAIWLWLTEHYIWASVLIVLSLFPVGIGILMGMSLIRSGGNWTIEIRDGRIDWDSPDQSVEKSFSLALADIDKVLIEIEDIEKDGSEDIDGYAILEKSGNRRRLTNVSGVDVKAFANALVAEGIPMEKDYSRCKDRRL